MLDAGSTIRFDSGSKEANARMRSVPDRSRQTFTPLGLREATTDEYHVGKTSRTVCCGLEKKVRLIPHYPTNTNFPFYTQKMYLLPPTDVDLFMLLGKCFVYIVVLPGLCCLIVYCGVV